MSMFCENCGAKLAEDAQFCEECGAKILPASQVPPPSDQEAGAPYNRYQQLVNNDSFGSDSQYKNQNYRQQEPASQQPDIYNNYNSNGIQNRGYGNPEQRQSQYNNQNGVQNRGYGNPEPQPGQYASQNQGQVPAPGKSKKSGVPKAAILGGVALVAVAAVGAFLILGKIKGGQNEEESVPDGTYINYDQSSSQTASSGNSGNTGRLSAREQASALDASSTTEDIGNYGQETPERNYDSYQEAAKQDDSFSDTINTDMIGRKAKEIAGKHSSGSSDSSEEEFLPSTFAKKGKRDILQDGTVMYMNSVGDYVANVWVEDNGKYYYTGPDGSMIKDNYSADGYWCGSDGQWDKSVKQRNEDPEPWTGTYEGFVSTWEVKITKDSNYGTATFTYTSFGGTPVVYDLTPLGHGVYLAESKDFQALMSVSEDGKVLVVSQAGITEECTLK